MAQKYFWLLLISLVWLAGACSRDKAAGDDVETIVLTTPAQDTAVVDTLTSAPEDGVTVTTPASEAVPNLPQPQQESATQPKPQPSQKKQQQPQKQDPAPSDNKGSQADAPAGGAAKEVFKEGTYRLVSVQGDQLPLVLDMTTECNTKLLSGELTLRNGQLQFQSYTTEECAGQARGQQKHEAEGSYKLADNQIFFNIRSGDALGDAVGVVEENAVRLQQIGNDEEQQEVDWVFRLQ